VVGEVQESVKYGWIVRKSDDDPWVLLTYRWHDKASALDTLEHWQKHYAQAKCVEIDEKWTVIGE
jgi:hypothetical protein